MKKVFIYFSLVIAVVLSSCDDITDYNEDAKSASEVDPAYLVSYATENIARQWGNIDYNVNADNLWSNYLTQCTYTTECMYDPTSRDIGGYIWDNIYTEALSELKEAKSLLRATETLTDEDEAINVNELAIVKILEVFSYQYLVDDFGDVPFTEACDINNTTPAYDDAATIYSAIADSLNDALEAINTNYDGFDSDDDLLFSGDVSSWKKFGASVLLKIGMRLADVNESTASELVNKAINYGVIDSNDDNASFAYQSSYPYYNPWYDFFNYDSRSGDFVAADLFVDSLYAYSDPRIDYLIEDKIAVIDSSGAVNDTTYEYVGGEYGASSNSYSSHSHPTSTIWDDAEYPGMLIDYASVSFFKAEAVERGFITGDAEEYYIDGITASFDYWGLSSDDLTTYLAQDKVAYSSSDWKTKIGMQKYFAQAYILSPESWIEARRLDVPQLAAAAGNSVANPKRMIYPADESLSNGEEYDKACTNLGGDGDALTTPVFWDVN